jgi:hypothetical protein
MRAAGASFPFRDPTKNGSNGPIGSVRQAVDEWSLFALAVATDGVTDVFVGEMHHWTGQGDG